MKIRVFIYTISIFLILLIQSTLLNYVKIYGVKPNLLIIFIISVALLRGNVEGGVVGFFAGLSLDFAFGKLIGFYALLGLYLGIAIGSINKRLFRENYFIVVFFTFISTIIYETVMQLLSLLLENKSGEILAFIAKVFPEAIYNSIISIFIYAIVIKLNHKLEETKKAARKY